MKKNMVCIECPNSCLISVDIDNGKVTKLTGAKCPKGAGYAASEASNPVRILTSTVLAEGLSLKMVPVRTDRPIPKKELLRAAEEMRRIKIQKPVDAGDTVADNFLGLGVKLVATRNACRIPKKVS